MWWKFLVLLTFSYVNGETRLDPLVDTTQGLIKGLRTDDGYSMFLGIPYAVVDEDNPFGASRPYPYFDSVYEAFDDSPACPQMIRGVATGSLDCLRLNVFVPNKASSRNKLPVIVWIHGGGFNTGFSSQHYHGPKFLVQHDIIFVSLNYRLGPYGFMCLETPEIPGNQGIKDQLTALRWIKNNIESFGGDVNKITLMGESAGSVSVEAHLLSEHEKLFNQIILQSGAISRPRGAIESDATVPLKIAEHLGFITDNLSEALTFLTKADPRLVIAATSALSLNLYSCIEKKFDGIESILTERPYNLDVPKVRGMNILAGFNDREGLMLDASKPSDYFKQANYFRNMLQQIFVYDEDFTDMEDIVRHFYVGDSLDEEVRDNIIDFEGDFIYAFPVQWSIERYLRQGAQNIYQYMFCYDGDRNVGKISLNITAEGASHADELGYLFIMSASNTPISAEDQLVIDRMTTLWTNFAKYGNPTPEATELVPFTWTPITEDTIPYLNIDSEVSMKTRPLHNRLTFWKLFYKANQPRLKD